jgi:hypothetical protein
MPYQVRLNPQSQRKDTGGFRSPGGGDDMDRGGVNRRPQLFLDHGIDLPKLVVQLGPENAQSDGVPEGGLLLSQPPRVKSDAPLDQAGKLVGVEDGDG